MCVASWVYCNLQLLLQLLLHTAISHSHLPYSPYALLPLQAATPAPITPAGEAAAASAAAAAAQQAEQEQLRQAAIQDDGVLRFDFGGTVSAVLKDHEQAAQASAEQAVPITDAVQEQLLVLDQASLEGWYRGRMCPQAASMRPSVQWLCARQHG